MRPLPALRACHGIAAVPVLSLQPEVAWEQHGAMCGRACVSLHSVAGTLSRQVCWLQGELQQHAVSCTLRLACMQAQDPNGQLLLSMLQHQQQQQQQQQQQAQPPQAQLQPQAPSLPPPHQMQGVQSAAPGPSTAPGSAGERLHHTLTPRAQRGLCRTPASCRRAVHGGLAGGTGPAPPWHCPRCAAARIGRCSLCWLSHRSPHEVPHSGGAVLGAGIAEPGQSPRLDLDSMFKGSPQGPSGELLHLASQQSLAAQQAVRGPSLAEVPSGWAVQLASTHGQAGVAADRPSLCEAGRTPVHRAWSCRLHADLGYRRPRLLGHVWRPRSHAARGAALAAWLPVASTRQCAASCPV